MDTPRPRRGRRLTELDFLSDFYHSILGSSLAQALPQGSIYMAETSPRDGKGIFATLNITASTAEQLQRGVLVLTIYVPDLHDGRTGSAYPDLDTLYRLSHEAQLWVESLSAEHWDYRTYQREAIALLPLRQSNSHILSVRLYFDYFDIQD